MSCCGAFIMPVDLPGLAPTKPRTPFRLSGRMVLACFVGFFAVVAGANAVMMTVAIRTMSGVEVKSAYKTSQRFNGEIARMQAQTERGWQAQAQIVRDGDDARVELDMRDNARNPLTGLEIEARLLHPAARHEDRGAMMSEKAPGLYVAPLKSVHAGAWTLVIEAKRDGEPLYTSRSRILLKE
jgi:nitrogen fixation protein FixH